MKKAFLLIIILFLLTGCEIKFELNGDITEAKYNDIVILNNDLKKVEKYINESEFSYKKPNEIFNNKLEIKTKTDLYKFSISENYIKYKSYYARNEYLTDLLKEINYNYYDKSFFSMKHLINYQINEGEKNILIDKGTDYIIITTEKELKNFKINLLEFNGKDYDDIDLLYSEEEIAEKKIVIRKNLEKSVIRISFKNPYNYEISTIVKLDDGKAEFKTN